MIRCHDFINGEYYEDYWTGERISTTEYYRRERKRQKCIEGKQYILIKTCEDKIKGKESYCSLERWFYYAYREIPPKNVVILSRNEYIKNEKGECYYRRFKGDDYLLLEVEDNVKLEVDKVEVIYGFFLCTAKGKGTLYTKEVFYKKFLK